MNLLIVKTKNLEQLFYRYKYIEEAKQKGFASFDSGCITKTRVYFLVNFYK